MIILTNLILIDYLPHLVMFGSNLAYFYNNINFNLILLTILRKDRKKHGSFISFLSQKVKIGFSSFHFGVGMAN
jgi:hypothetical protein